MEDSLPTGAVFIDLKKVFDTIVDYILLNKLQRYDVCDTTLLWCSSYLQGRSQRLEVDKVLSTPLDITSDVPQGSPFGPLLFKQYINGMPSCQSLRRRANARYISFFTLYGGQFTFLTQLLTLNYLLFAYDKLRSQVSWCYWLYRNTNNYSNIYWEVSLISSCN